MYKDEAITEAVRKSIKKQKEVRSQQLIRRRVDTVQFLLSAAWNAPLSGDNSHSQHVTEVEVEKETEMVKQRSFYTNGHYRHLICNLAYTDLRHRDQTNRSLNVET